MRPTHIIQQELDILGNEIDEIVFVLASGGGDQALKQLYVTKAERYKKLKEELRNKTKAIADYERSIYGI